MCGSSTQPQVCGEDGTWIPGPITGGVCNAECTPQAEQCKATVPQTCDAAGKWKDGAVAKDQCGAECNPGTKGCKGTLQQTCGSLGKWDAGKVVVDQCGAACTPNDLRCSVQIGQHCSSTGNWVGNESSAPCTCYVPGRFRAAGPNLVLDSTTGLTWESALHPNTAWTAASKVCEDLGMRLPTTAEWKAIMVNTKPGVANCQPASVPFDGAAMPTTSAQLGGSAPKFWTNEPESGFPGFVRVLIMAYNTPDLTWFPLESDDRVTVEHLYRCVK